MTSAWGVSWGNAWGDSWGAILVVTSGQSRSHRQWTREELDAYKDPKEQPVKLIWAKEPEVVEKALEILSEVAAEKPKSKPKTIKEDVRLALLKYLEEEGLMWKKEYERLIALEYDLLVKRKKREEEVIAILMFELF